MNKKQLTIYSLFALSISMISAQVQARTVIQNKGSDTLVNVAQAWAEEYRNIDKNVAVAVSGGGSGTGIAALINGTVDIANASRAMKQKEIDRAKKKGQNPIQHIVGYDALAVFLHHNSPINELSFEQLKEIFGRGGKATKWSDLDVTVPGCKQDKIVVVSRQNNSGTYAYFKKAALGKKGKFRQGTLDMHGSKDVVDLVEKTPCAIGYSGLAYANEHVKMACISKKTGDACVNPSVATASDRSYPIARPLFMYTNGEPAGETKKYLDWILSDKGQCILLKKGYAPVKDVKCD
ncbi:MAG: phosphate ABC transporter substrate-binding protein PstS family protein [Gammaproteobacteria bacterium]|nr:phosphate ABC transporter substrate-binding protein PstS family protein [Gammaproteobacteria bacterium]